MVYSPLGNNGMSQCMHRFVREHIVRGTWKKKTRPVLLNSWEASYFDINERKLLALAKADREAGRQVLIVNMKKNKKFQKEQLIEDGYTEIADCYADSVDRL